MNLRHLALAVAPLAFWLSSPVSADNIANCEAVLLETIKDEKGNGGAKVASYRPATEFMASVYSEDEETLYEIDGLKIQAIMCKRLDVLPTSADFKILASGIPFFISQSFETSDSDLLSIFFKDGAFRHSYKGPGLSEETEALLAKRMTEFNAKEHDLAEKEAALKASKSTKEKEEDTAQKDTNKTDPKTKTSEDSDADAEVKTEVTTDDPALEPNNDDTTEVTPKESADKANSDKDALSPEVVSPEAVSSTEETPAPLEETPESE